MAISETGVLESPGYPKYYYNNMWCKWKLVSPLDCDFIRINFTNIVLEENYDTLTVCLKNVCSEEDLIVYM